MPQFGVTRQLEGAEISLPICCCCLEVTACLWPQLTVIKQLGSSQAKDLETCTSAMALLRPLLARAHSDSDRSLDDSQC